MPRIMRKPTVENKYNLTMKTTKQLQIVDRSQIGEPLFWRNEAITGWCISENTAKNKKDIEFCTYNSYWIGIYDEEAKNKRKLRITCEAHGGMTSYNFTKFFDYHEIENEDDLLVQEKLLSKLNELIDKEILAIKES